jgi:hypothetical protein
MEKPSLLTISHNLFLTRDERYGMRDLLNEVDTIGICLPVWVNGLVTSEPAEEVYCRYRLRNYTLPGVEAVAMASDGFTISLGDKSMWQSMLDAKDGGCGSIYLSHQSTLTNNDVEVMAIHYINIQDIKVLIKENDAIC